MYFAKQDMDDQLFNREPKQETLEQIASKQFQKEFNKEVGNVLTQEL
jgi:hypothetical protein